MTMLSGCVVFESLASVWQLPDSAERSGLVAAMCLFATAWGTQWPGAAATHTRAEELLAFLLRYPSSMSMCVGFLALVSIVIVHVCRLSCSGIHCHCPCLIIRHYWGFQLKLSYLWF